ncbi:MAG: glycine zipper domain-containing protein [Steroidobacteraceae bacterium]
MIPLRHRAHRPWRQLLARTIVGTALALPCIALATPPSWAPAHGWRKKNDPAYAGYSGRQWDYDYGVRAGRCDRSEIGAVLGGVAGAAVGSEVGKGDNRVVAMVVGTVIGAAIGAEIGRRMDKTDRYCVGHALELGKAGQTVSWSNPSTRVSYQLTPLDKGVGEDGCRKFRLVATGGFGLSEGRTVACAGPDGVWNLAPDARMTRR